MLSDLSSDQKGGDLIYDSSSWALGCIQILPSLPVQRLFSLSLPFSLHDTRLGAGQGAVGAGSDYYDPERLPLINLLSSPDRLPFLLTQRGTPMQAGI